MDAAPARPPPPPSAPDAPQGALLLELIREMRDQRRSFDEAQKLAAAERRSERRWRMIFQALVFGAPVLLGLLYFFLFLGATGFRLGPWGDVVGVVRIEGMIGSNEKASAENIVPLLEKAFSSAKVKAVVLSIDSPGGAPVEAERIYSALESLKHKHPKPVVAVINNVGASAAYMVALRADKIVAGNYSLVGSIGAIMAPWRLDRAIAKADVSQRVYASGKLKSFLNPFTPVPVEADQKAQQLVDQLGGAFVAEVKARRVQLKDGVDVGTGEVWAGPEAKELGLIDALGTLEEYVHTTWSIRTYDFGPAAQGYSVLGRTLQDAMVGAIQRLAVPVPTIR
jgi:protease IV